MIYTINNKLRNFHLWIRGNYTVFIFNSLYWLWDE